MYYEEYGQYHQEIIILLHGGGLGCWNYHTIAQLLAQWFHVIVPALDGHDGSDSNFFSIEENAQTLIRFIDERFNGKVLLIGGLSLGGQVLIEMLSQRKDICSYAMIESALVIPMPFVAKLIHPMLVCYPLIKKRCFSYLQFYTLHMNPKYFEAYYHSTCRISKADMLSFLKANVLYEVKTSLSNYSGKVIVFVGGKERGMMKKSAMLLSKIIEDSMVECLKGYTHGDLSLNHPDEYVKRLFKLIDRNIK